MKTLRQIIRNIGSSNSTPEQIDILKEFIEAHLEAQKSAIRKNIYEAWDNGESIRMEHIELAYPIENIK